MKNKSLPYVIAVIVSLCVICAIGTLAIIINGDIISTPTPSALLPQTNFSTIIVQTAAAAQTQTMIFSQPTSTQSIMNTPTMIPPITLAPTWTAFPTDTPLLLPTLNILPGLPNSGVCSCAGDILNCSDFSTHNSAQACFASCTAQGVGDIHKLDQNNDGLACESLP